MRERERELSDSHVSPSWASAGIRALADEVASASVVQEAEEARESVPPVGQFVISSKLILGKPRTFQLYHRLAQTCARKDHQRRCTEGFFVMWARKS